MAISDVQFISPWITMSQSASVQGLVYMLQLKLQKTSQTHCLITNCLITHF